MRVGFCLVLWAETLHPLQGQIAGGHGKRGGSGGKEVGGDGERRGRALGGK